MVFFELLGNIITSVLIAYLAFTNSIADHILVALGDPREERAAQTTEPPLEGAVTTIEETASSPNITELSVRLATSLKNSASRVLLDNPDFQQAAVGAAESADTMTPDGSVPLNVGIESALVNIFCQYKTEQYVRTTTGTGFFVHPRGIILTNAHVAQFLLLESNNSNIIDAGCVIRSGNPATPKYHAELLYISPMWILENASLITEENPRGTGERDYALLYAASTTDDTVLQEEFPFISVDTALLTIYTKGIEVLTAGYPAEILQREGARAKLVPVIASTTISDLYTFGSNYADVFTISESPVGEQGASGGPVVRNDGSAIGIITTKGDLQTDGSRSLRSITLSYIDRTIREETGFLLAENMRGDLSYRSSVFKNALVPFLANLLTSEIGGAE